MKTLAQIKTDLLNTGVRTRGLSDTAILDLAHDKDVINNAEYIAIFSLVNKAQPEQAQPEQAQPEQAQPEQAQPEQAQPEQPKQGQAQPMQNDKTEQLAKLLNEMTQGAQLDENRVIELIKTHTSNSPRLVEVKTLGNEKVKKVGFVHPVFDEALAWVSIKKDVYFYGETGSGKSTTARKIAEALDMSFFSMGALMSKFETLGALTPQGYSPSIIRKWLESDKGVLCIDEIDASNANALTSVMAIFDRNGEMTFPDGVTLARKPDHQIIITGNTIGEGANAGYNSRMKLDDAFLTRFQRLAHEYDTDLENFLGGEKVAQYARNFRAELVKMKMKGSIIAPRTIENAGDVYKTEGLLPAIKKQMLKTAFKQGLNEKDYKAITDKIGVLS